MQYLKKSIAIAVEIGPMNSVTNLTVSPVTGLTIGQFDSLEIIQNGAAVSLTGQTMTEIGEGYYTVQLRTTNLGTARSVKVAYAIAGSIVPGWNDFEVMDANWIDSVRGSDVLKADVTQLDGSAVQQTTGHIHAYDDAGVAIAKEGTLNVGITAITADTVAIKAKTDGLTFTGADVKATLDGEEVVTDSGSRTASKADVSALALEASLAAGITAITADIAGLNNLSSAQAESAADAALSTYGGPTNAEMEARTRPTADYFDQTSDEVITNAASRAASKADVSGLALNATVAKDATVAKEATLNTNSGITDGLIAALENISIADILGAAITELSSVPGASPTLSQALSLAFMVLKNKITQTATQFKAYDDAGAVLGTKTTADDSTTFSQSKMA